MGLKSASTVVSSARRWWVSDLRARSYTLSVQGVRWCINLRARPSALLLQGVRQLQLRAWSSALTARTVEANGCNQTSSHDYHIYHQNVPRGGRRKLSNSRRSLINDNRGDALRAAPL